VFTSASRHFCLRQAWTNEQYTSVGLVCHCLRGKARLTSDTSFAQCKLSKPALDSPQYKGLTHTLLARNDHQGIGQPLLLTFQVSEYQGCVPVIYEILHGERYETSSYPCCHRRLDSIEIQGSVVVREQQRYNVEPDPEYEGCYKSQGYDDVSELDHDVGREVMDFEGHKRVVRVPR